MSSLELFPISQLIHLKLQHTVAKPAEHSDDDKRGDSMQIHRKRPRASLLGGAAWAELPLGILKAQPDAQQQQQ